MGIDCESYYLSLSPTCKEYHCEIYKICGHLLISEQHGGPELFTFDNHDPRGGCVLLNNGTVKFIRTEEELHALRWK